jgi:hypothetical protein
MDWQTTIQSWGSQLVDRWSSAEFVQPYEVDKLRLQALGQAGYYTEGQPGTRVPAQPGGLTITPTMLLLGGAALLIVMLSKD